MFFVEECFAHSWVKYKPRIRADCQHFDNLCKMIVLYMDFAVVAYYYEGRSKVCYQLLDVVGKCTENKVRLMNQHFLTFAF